MSLNKLVQLKLLSNDFSILQVSVSLRLAGTCLCQLLVDYKPALAKVLTSVDGRQLLSDSKET